jgi:hypothetical protein
LIFFFLAISIGIAAGLVYGWVVNPREVVNAEPEALRMDYKTDVVLMVAELYQVDGDLMGAQARLSFISKNTPLEIITAALVFAENVQYDPLDVGTMLALKGAFEGNLP